MSKTLYQYFKSLVKLPSDEPVGNWRNVQTWLEEAGYKTRSFAENRFKTSLSVDQLVRIVNISFNQHIGAIDINIQVTIPKEIELKAENTKE